MSGYMACVNTRLTDMGEVMASQLVLDGSREGSTCRNENKCGVQHTVHELKQDSNDTQLNYTI